MKNLRLIKPTLAHKDRHLTMMDEWQAYGGHIAPWAVRLHGLSYEEWLDDLQLLELKDNYKPGWMPQFLYFLMDGDTLIGSIAIRPVLNDYLQQFGGHIGYGIRPSQRGKGYGKVQLKLGLELCKERFGLEQVLITCNMNNLPSAGVILANGGIHENDVVDDGTVVSRYFIRL